MSRICALAFLVACATCSGRALHPRADAADGAPAEADSASPAEGGQPADAERDAPTADLVLDSAVERGDAFANERDSGPVCVAFPQPPPDLPWRQSVRFHFEGSSSGYVVSDGFECLPFTIEAQRAGATVPVVVGTRSGIVCEGPSPPATAPARALALASASPALLTWDARELEPHLLCVDCAAQGWPMPPVQLTAYRRVPVAPGHYRATFAILDPLPATCRLYGDVATCDPMRAPYLGPLPPIALCPSSRTLSVEFDLPATDGDSGSGDVDVTVVDAL